MKVKKQIQITQKVCTNSRVIVTLSHKIKLLIK